MRREVLRLIVLSSCLALLLAVAVPAKACGCGVYIPREGEGDVVQERALIRWDGVTEDIVMALSVQGNATEAAWILPVPAQATVQLAEAELFESLQELTRPRVEYRYGLFPPGPLVGSAADGGAPGAPPVLLLEQQTLGPFEVSTLAATDATALSGWLTNNGYNFPTSLAGVLQTYVQQGWFYIAIRLSPGAQGEALSGELDPLWITFQTAEIVYPMRPSALATGRLPVYLYVLAEHRVEKNQTFGDLHIAFADWIEPATLPAGSPLALYVTRRFFLTKFEEQIWDPSRINADYTFTFAAEDEVYHDVEIEYIYDIGGLPIFLLVLCGVGLLILALIAGLAVFIRRRRLRQPKAI